jgi:hypothetical protein
VKNSKKNHMAAACVLTSVYSTVTNYFPRGVQKRKDYGQGSAVG